MSKCAVLLPAAVLSAALLACSSDDRAPASGSAEAPGGAPAPSDNPNPETNPSPNPGGDDGPPASNEATNDALPLAPDRPAPPADVPPADGEPAAEPVQEALPALPSVRQEHSVVALDGEIYVLGGFTPNVTSTLQAFDPASGTWRDAAEAPLALHHANAAAVDGRMIVAGYYVGASFTTVNGRVLEYDPALDAWSERGLMPAGSERASACVATLGGRIYLFGGARLGASVTDASAYDVVTDTWEELPPLPEPREHCLAAAIGDTLFIAAGRSGGIGGFQPNTWAFDPAQSAYTARAPIPTPRGGVAGAVLDGKLLVFGGEGNGGDASGVFDDVEAYDAASDSWSPLPPMLEPRHGLGAAELDGRVYLPGGASAQGFGAVGEHTVLIY
jgi:N-acetylneuraminic acid mutarotase